MSSGWCLGLAIRLWLTLGLMLQLRLRLKLRLRLMWVGFRANMKAVAQVGGVEG